MSDERLITITDAAKVLGCSRTLVYRALNEGKLQAVALPLQRRGGQRLKLSEVLSLLPPGEREAARTRLG